MKELQEVLIEYFLDYFNNYLTVAKFAEHNFLSEEDARLVLDIGKKLHEAQAC